MNVAERIALHKEARESVDQEIRLEVWTAPKTKAERLEAYEARIEAVTSSIVSGVALTPAEEAPATPAPAAEQPAPASDLVQRGPAPAAELAPAQPAEQPKPAAAPSKGAADLKDDLDDGAELF